jgi:pimeloyl-ACP methyl ester carboxylesterase
MESRLVYQPPAPRDGAKEATSLGAEEIWFESEDQTKLHGWFLPVVNAPRAIVFFHGNGEDAEYNLNWAAELRTRFRAAVFVFDYRGYGHSEGSAFENGVILDGIAAQQWLADRMKWNTSEIILYGRSLGGGVAVAAAAELGAKALIVENTFANMVDVAADKYSYVPVRVLMRNSYLSQKRIANYSGPFLQFHGADDVLVPIDLAKPLCESAPTTNKQFVEVPGCGHNDPLPEHCYETLVKFLDSLPQ